MAVPKILVTNKIRQCGIDFLQEHGFELLWSKSNSVEDVRKIACACDGIIARMTPVKQTLIDAAPNLKIIGMHGVGLDGIDIPYATQKGIAVTHTPAANCISVAEHAMGAILNLSKKTIPADKALREEHRFQDRDLFIGHDIQGKILGIVGLGRIGRQLAQMAGLGFGMKVIAYDPYVPEKEMSQVGAGVEKKSTLEEIMAVSDFISFHVQLTPETTGMVNYDLLKLMKPTAYFINEMRGALVVESDLCRALREGIIAGAAVDVFAQEPPPDDCELLKAPNLIATPHIAASTYESLDRIILALAEEFNQFFNGGKMQFLVNPDYKEHIENR